MYNEVVLTIFSWLYNLIAMPALAIIGITYYRKRRSNGGLIFSVGAVSMALGAVFNRLFPYMRFLNDTQPLFPKPIDAIMAFAFMIQIIGFCIMVLGMGIITFKET